MQKALGPGSAGESASGDTEDTEGTRVFKTCRTLARARLEAGKTLGPLGSLSRKVPPTQVCPLQ